MEFLVLAVLKLPPLPEWNVLLNNGDLMLPHLCQVLDGELFLVAACHQATEPVVLAVLAVLDAAHACC